jgi:hypothetical protein
MGHGLRGLCPPQSCVHGGGKSAGPDRTGQARPNLRTARIAGGQPREALCRCKPADGLLYSVRATKRHTSDEAVLARIAWSIKASGSLPRVGRGRPVPPRSRVDSSAQQTGVDAAAPHAGSIPGRRSCRPPLARRHAACSGADRASSRPRPSLWRTNLTQCRSGGPGPAGSRPRSCWPTRSRDEPPINSADRTPPCGSPWSSRLSLVLMSLRWRQRTPLGCWPDSAALACCGPPAATSPDYTALSSRTMRVRRGLSPLRPGQVSRTRNGPTCTPHSSEGRQIGAPTGARPLRGEGCT